MAGAIDEDTRRTIAGGREALGAALKTVQRHLQVVFVVFVVTLVGTIVALQNYIWEALKQDLLTEGAEVVTITPFEVILLQFKIGLIVGAIVSVPVLLYLSRDELRQRGWLPQVPLAKWKFALLLGGVLTLFVLGIAYAYLFFFPLMFDFLISTATNSGFNPTYSITKWMEFIVLLALSFGIAAQLPLVMSTLAYAEIVPYETFRDYWKHAIVGLYAGGALFTPPDPLTQLMWATPLVALYAGSLKFTRIVVTVKRSSEQFDFRDIARQNWNRIAGMALLSFVIIYVFFTTGGLTTLNDLFGSSSLWPTLTPLPESTGLSRRAIGVLSGAGVAILVAVVVFYRIIARELTTLDPAAAASVGDPAELDVSELDAAGVRAAPLEPFEEMDEDELMSIASDALENDDPERAEALLDKFDEANEETSQPQAESTGEGTPEAAGESGGAPPEAGDEDSNVVSETTAGMVDAFTEDETTEDDIGGYYYDIAFILESLTSKAFRIVGLFMVVLGGLFFYLYQRGIRDINADFLSRLPAGMSAEEVQPVALHPVEHLIFEIKFSALVAALVTLPLVLYYAWPALRERGLVTGDKRVLLVWGGTLFVGIGIGSAIGYSIVAPAVISWLAQDALGANMIIAYRIKYYAWMVVYTTIGIGLLAEVPVSMFLFHFGGLVSFKTMWGRWREVTIGIFTFAMFITPSGMFTMLMIAIPLALAFYFGLAVLWLATLGGRRGGGGTMVEEPA
ncbi:twin-arginine translocase subunit TatC [Halapricum hydrolyticum]|uniref:Sec-independent protein translocase protein TatC n=1 Tax=Halapricum hydrolyticum TaxID=2979991 RepID=A0AAE3IGD4_9EURY|nr:twin-arginine translocase subunit TatC [Halapricum hydrolyticum]MCU4718842.1 twin-arginine translocase subunit TatC [Halapricum hydrolyticum]MCU4727880.1 twin-arginine translocase subunit TatC [Halapricum hydrolyticum]